MASSLTWLHTVKNCKIQIQTVFHIDRQLLSRCLITPLQPIKHTLLIYMNAGKLSQYSCARTDSTYSMLKWAVCRRIQRICFYTIVISCCCCSPGCCWCKGSPPARPHRCRPLSWPCEVPWRRRLAEDPAWQWWPSRRCPSAHSSEPPPAPRGKHSATEGHPDSSPQDKRRWNPSSESIMLIYTIVHWKCITVLSAFVELQEVPSTERSHVVWVHFCTVCATMLDSAMLSASKVK